VAAKLSHSLEIFFSRLARMLRRSHLQKTFQSLNSTIPCKGLALLDNSTLPFHMFFSPFLALAARYPACLDPYCFSPFGFSPSSLSLIPAAHSASKTVSRSQPSKQNLPSDCWLPAVSCQLQLSRPAAVPSEAPRRSLRHACLPLAPLRARKPAHAASLSPLGATLTKNLGEGTKRSKEGSRSTHVSIVTRRNPTYSLYFQRLRNNFVRNGGWGYLGATREKNAGDQRLRELDYVEWNSAFCIAVRASGFFMNVSQTRPLL
jgi:hypothetical protein